MKYLINLAFILIAFSNFHLLAQRGIYQDNFNIYLDYGRYRYDHESTFLEIYYSVMDITRDASRKPENCRLLIELADSEIDTTLASQVLDIEWEEQMLETPEEKTAKVGLIKSVIPEGNYSLVMYHLDPVSNQKLDSIQYEFTAGAFNQDKLTLSDLELSSNIITNSHRRNSTFYKNTMEVYPNPSRLFGKANPMLYYYIELYNLQNQKGNDEIIIQAVIADRDANIRAKKKYRRTKRYESLVERGNFNVSKLESGVYTLIFAVTDSTENYSVYRRSDFVINNPDVRLVREDEDELNMMFSAMPEDQIDEMFDQASYIATENEQNIYRSLNSLESKRKFLIQFWQNRNNTNPNFHQEYYSRVDYANENYRAAGSEGWKTDRGRVYIVYGAPDNIERNPFDGSFNPYEIWFYEAVEGGVEFDFIDISGYGNYELVNSTARNEINDPNWRKYLIRR